MSTHEAMSAIALANYAISQREYDAAMTEVMGTSDKARW